MRRGDAPPPTRPAAPFTTTIRVSGRVIVHRSMAPDWARAVDLAMRAVRSDGLVGLDEVPDAIEVRRG